MKKFLSLSIILTLFTLACKKQTSEQFVRFTQISIYYKSTNNVDLLNPANTGSFKAADIDIYYLRNGIRERVNNNNLDDPENFRIRIDDNGRHYLHLGLSEYVTEENLSTTFIEFNNGSFTDTIKAEIVKKNTMVHYEKLWYNNTLMFDPANPAPTKIEIVK